MRLSNVLLSALLTLTLGGCEYLNPEPEPVCATDFIDPPDGELQTEFGEIEFTSADVTLNHRSAGEGAGCLNAVELLFYQANNSGCTMTVTASNQLTDDGYLEITDVVMRASGECPDYPDEIEGGYTEDGLGDSGIEVLGVATGDHLGCYEDGLVVHLEGAIKRYTGVETSEKNVNLEKTTILVNGRMSSLGGDDECPGDDD